jgi:hypothetical protein
MKTFIAASIIALSSSTAIAQSFDFERQFGTQTLFPTLVGGHSSVNNVGLGGSTSFAYERAFGTPELFPSLVAEDYEGKVSIGDPIVDQPDGHDSIWGWDFPVGG